jgi:ABC-type branched-subunit amino acid transport system ATPase component
LTVGERRLLAVARAAATGAPVLAFDEPAAGMSAAERETLTAVLRTLAQAGRAILVVEHDLRLVAATADVVTVLDEGRAIAHGAPDAVIADATVQRVYLGAAA